MTQISEILHHLQKHRTITSWQAITTYGVTRLSAVIFELRKKYKIESVMIDSVNRYDEHGRYAKYVYRGKLKKRM